MRHVVFRALFFIIISICFGILCRITIGSLLSANCISFIERLDDISPDSRLRVMDMALKFSPDDPMVRYVRGNAYFIAAKENFSDELMNVSLAELKRAVELSPNDFRLWLGYGRALDRYGKSDEARKSFEHALSLAPTYFDVQWALGNHLIRDGDSDAAFIHMNAALASRPSSYQLVFDYAWNILDGNVNDIANAIPPPDHLTNQFILMLIRKGKWEEAINIWNKSNNKTAIKTDKDSLLSNGSFEEAITYNSELAFNYWRITPMHNDRISLDSNNSVDENTGLRINFNDENNNAHIVAQQIVPAKNNTNYCLNYSVKTEKLESLSTPKVELFDPVDSQKAYVESIEIPTRNNDWTGHSISLTTSSSTIALIVRIERLPCDTAPCPISGRVWFDNFKLYECAINSKD